MGYIEDRCTDGRVEEYTLDEEAGLGPRQLHLYRVEMKRDGDSEIRHARVFDDSYYAREKAAGGMEINPWGGQLMGYVLATSKEHAAKIANEKRVQLIALNEWPGKE